MKRTLLTRMFLVALLALLAAGCATVQTSGPKTHVRSPAMAEAAQRAAQDATLAGQARRDNVDAISRLLATLDDAGLSAEAAATPAEDPLYNFLGRALIARGLPLPHPFARGNWRFDAGDRPPADRDGYRPPQRLAVLLPLSGSLAIAASPVRDGFLTAYYGETRRRPELRFYDTAAGVQAAYDRAVAEGNDFVVGPLGRDEVTTLFSRASLPVPVLALNRGESRPPAGNASFSLSPEDEGAAAADSLYDSGARHVLVVASAEESQRRAAEAFRESFAARGGSVAGTVNEATADFAAFMAKPGGVDAMFIALKGSSARTVMPKLALAGMAMLPKVATSQIVSGTGKDAGDSALDGIRYPTEAWVATGAPGLPPASMVAANLPTARGAAARLFAFGYDAWRVCAWLEYLATANGASLPGATGTLRIDGFGNVLRTPAWAVFHANANDGG
ncbi:MAG: penicillin-binding protein activator [Thermomonas sp.]